MLLPDELDLVVCRHDATRLLFAAWLKFYTRHGRPRGRSELHDGAVMSLARQLTVSPGVIGLMAWDGGAASGGDPGASGFGSARRRTRTAGGVAGRGGYGPGAPL